jgi:hypothetical protein
MLCGAVTCEERGVWGWSKRESERNRECVNACVGVLKRGRGGRGGGGRGEGGRRDASMCKKSNILEREGGRGVEKERERESY